MLFLFLDERKLLVQCPAFLLRRRRKRMATRKGHVLFCIHSAQRPNGVREHFAMAFVDDVIAQSFFPRKFADTTCRLHFQFGSAKAGRIGIRRRSVDLAFVHRTRRCRQGLSG